MGFAMAAPIALRRDYTPSDLRSLARRTRDAGQARRLLALAVILDGGSRSDAAENVWQFLRDNWLSNRVFRSYADILDHSYFAWNSLMAQPRKIMSIGL